MHGISVFVPLWINLNCLGGGVHIPESSEVGDGQWNRNGHIVFVASPVAALTPLHSLLLANMHRFYCCLVVGGGAIVGRFANHICIFAQILNHLGRIFDSIWKGKVGDSCQKCAALLIYTISLIYLISSLAVLQIISAYLHRY